MCRLLRLALLRFPGRSFVFVGDSTFGNSGLGLLVYMLSSGAGIGAGFLGSFL